jgi:membrane protein
MLKTLWQLTKRTAQAYSRDNCSHMAAAISYYVLFSIVPLAIFLVAIFGLVVRDEKAQENVSNRIVDFLSLSSGTPSITTNVDAIEARYGAGAVDEINKAIAQLTHSERQTLGTRLKDGESITLAGRTLGPDELTARPDNAVIHTIRGVTRASGALTVIGLLGLLWSASAMFGAIRRSFNIAWKVEGHRPVVRQKLRDLSVVASLGLLLVASIAGTAALRTLREISDTALGPLSTGTGFFWSVLPYMLPAVFSFAVFVLLYRWVPSVKHEVSDVWPGALLATVLFELLKNSFALYVAKFNNYASAYGALGGILLFLFWTYLSASILLVGAELAAEYASMRRGEYALFGPPERSNTEEVIRFLRGLVFRNPDPVKRRSTADDAGADPALEVTQRRKP